MTNTAEKSFGLSEKALGAMPNTHVLCFVLGWQGGTIHQVAAALGVTTQSILDADYDIMGELCRKAQAVRWKEIQAGNALAVKHLRICINALKADRYALSVKVACVSIPQIPEWLERADGVCKILEESL